MVLNVPVMYIRVSKPLGQLSVLICKRVQSTKFDRIMHLFSEFVVINPHCGPNDLHLYSQDSKPPPKVSSKSIVPPAQQPSPKWTQSP